MANSKALILSSIKMALATFCSRILGLVREQVLAFMFGASSLTDAFYVAFRIPNLLRDLFAEGAFSAAFVPAFVEQKGKSIEEARRLLWSLFLFLFLSTTLISLLTIWFAPEIVSVFAPGFQDDALKMEVTVALTRMMAPFLLFVSIAALFMGALNSMGYFFLPALSPASFNLVMIGSMLFFPGLLITQGYPKIYSLGLGVFLGGMLQALIQFPLIWRSGLGPSLKGGKIHEKTGKVIKLLGPGLIGFAATQVNLIVNTVLATATIVGAVSWLSYAFRLFQLPVGILSVSLGNANLVHFSRAWKSGDEAKASELLLNSFFMSWIVILPAMSVTMLFAEEIVHLIFERGEFGSNSTLMTAKALFWYGAGLPFYGLYKILVPAFYTLDRQKIPVYASVFSITCNIIFCVTLTPIYGFEVLAIGTSLSMFLNSAIQLLIMRTDLNLSLAEFLNFRFARILLAASAGTALAFGLANIFPYAADGSLIIRIIWLGTAFSFVFLSYGALLFALGERSIVLKIMAKIQAKLPF